MILACPNCKWQDTNLKEVNYVLSEPDPDDKSREGYVNYRIWCFSCMWQGVIGFKVNVLTMKEGRPK